MKPPAAKLDPDSLPTQWSLLARLKTWDDHVSWQQFFDTYWRLIYNVAIKAGLTDAEAQDVVQDTVITVAKNLKDFKTDPAFGSFKGWLLKTTHWRIINQFNKRRPDQLARQHRSPDDTRQTATTDRIPDCRGTSLASVWDSEWQDYLTGLALERLKNRVKPKHYQIFFLHVIKGQSVREVAQALGVTIAHIYLVKHRLIRQFKQDVANLERELG